MFQVKFEPKFIFHTKFHTSRSGVGNFSNGTTKNHNSQNFPVFKEPLTFLFQQYWVGSGSYTYETYKSVSTISARIIK